jgi:hypothetical protein
LAFFKNDWIPFVCSTDVSIAITSDKLQIRTAGDGYWKKFTYQNAAFAITLSGVLKFDAANWTGWDMIDNHLNFSHVLVRCSFDDKNGNIRTIQGYVMIESSTLGFSPGALVKNDFSMQGNGKLDMFDGLVPCPTAITSITVDGQTASDGIVHVSYTYTGDAYQIKYKIDGSGNYLYALADLVLSVPGLALGSHSIEIIPVCVNGYEGSGLTQDFVVTQSQVCGTVISDITITPSIATSVYAGTATQMKYRIDGGIWQNNSITYSVPIGNLPVGVHTIEMVPICSNNVEGTGLMKPFTIAIQPSQSIINYSFALFGTGDMLIYVNGVLTVSLNASTGSPGSLVVPNGATIKWSISSSLDGRPGSRALTLRTQDATTGVILNNQTATGAAFLQYIFTTNGDTFNLTGTISP